MRLECKCDPRRPDSFIQHEEEAHRWDDPYHHNTRCEDCGLSLRAWVQSEKPVPTCRFTRCTDCGGIREGE